MIGNCRGGHLPLFLLFSAYFLDQVFYVVIFSLT